MIVRSRPLRATAVLNVLVVALIWVVGGAADIVSGIVALCLAPVAVRAVAEVAQRIDGRRNFALTAAAVYAVLPLIAWISFLAPYRHFYLHEVAPSLVGLHAPAWFALGVGLVAVSSRAPAFVLAGVGLVAAGVAVSYWGTGPLHDVRNGLHETAWSITFLAWLIVAGVAGVARRSPLLAVTVAGWLAFFVLRAAHAGYADGMFWHGIAPAMPVAALLLTSLWLLVPRLRPGPAPAA